MGKFIDLTGMKFGKWTVLEYVGKSKWLCRCECGTEKIIEGKSLKNGRTKSCGCTFKQQYDLTGMKFGRLTVIERAGSSRNGKNAKWLCRCECGNITTVIGCCLRSGNTQSCGCLQKERAKKVGEESAIDLTGQKFGRLTVIERAGSDENGSLLWLCKCECGNEKIIKSQNLREGATQSCGCFRQNKMSKMVKEKWQNNNFRQMQSKKAKDTLTGSKHHSYKGGITPIAAHLRSLHREWFDKCKQQANYTCELTGQIGGQLHTHHLKAFNTIVLEAHEINNINIKDQVKDYTDEELQLLEEYVASWHKDSSNAVVLCDRVHNLFHSLYGHGDNTPEQFEEFKERYLAGEFNNPNPTNNKVA